MARRRRERMSEGKKNIIAGLIQEYNIKTAVDMHVENLDSDKMICYPVIQGERINYQNK